jgi:hypothetical protein
MKRKKNLGRGKRVRRERNPWNWVLVMRGLEHEGWDRDGGGWRGFGEFLGEATEVAGPAREDAFAAETVWRESQKAGD